MDARERSFLEEAQRHRASGRDLDLDLWGSSPADAMVSPQEQSFIDQTVSYHASGGRAR